MSRKHKATIQIGLLSVKLADIIFRALKPELNSKAQMTIQDNVLTLNLEAGTVAMLRALTNSYLRWIGTIVQVSSIFYREESLKKIKA